MARLPIKDVNDFLNLNERFVEFLEKEKASASVKVAFSDVTVLPNALEARLKLTLSAPPRDTVMGTYLTRNGIGTNEGFQYIRKSGTFFFHPGGPTEQEVVIVLKGNNAVGKTVEVVLSNTMSGGSVSRQVGTIRFSTDLDVPAPSGYQVSFETNFIEGFAATDTGLDNGNPCWQSRPAHGRTQDGNSELGLYTDPVLYPSTDPFPIVDGKRVLRSEKLITPLSYGNRQWNYTASMITSRTLKTIGPGDRVEARFAMPVLGKRGAWPAFWLMPTNGTWPPEIDLMEWPINSGHNAWTYYTTQHWTQDYHQQRNYPIDIRTLGISDDLTNFHTYGVSITEDTLSFDIDGKITTVMENRSPKNDWYVLLNVAMGGSWPGSPTTNTVFPCDMILDWIRFYEPIS